MKISQAMIVKNEEKNIVQALSWGKGVVSEQIVVDGKYRSNRGDCEEYGSKSLFFPLGG